MEKQGNGETASFEMLICRMKIGMHCLTINSFSGRVICSYVIITLLQVSILRMNF